MARIPADLRGFEIGLAAVCDRTDRVIRRYRWRPGRAMAHPAGVAVLKALGQSAGALDMERQAGRVADGRAHDRPGFSGWSGLAVALGCLPMDQITIRQASADLPVFDEETSLEPVSSLGAEGA
jgi:hypothetical protein